MPEIQCCEPGFFEGIFYSKSELNFNFTAPVNSIFDVQRINHNIPKTICMVQVSGYCDRCYLPTGTFSSSYFNRDMICIECKEREKAHPLYTEAKRIENQEIDRGNFSFPGIGLPEDLKPRRRMEVPHS